MDPIKKDDGPQSDESESLESLFGGFLPVFGVAGLVVTVVFAVTFVVLIGAARLWLGR